MPRLRRWPGVWTAAVVLLASLAISHDDPDKAEGIHEPSQKVGIANSQDSLANELALITQRIERDDTSTIDYVRRAAIYEETRDLASAIKDLDKALSLSPNDADLLFPRGRVHYLMGEYGKAHSDLSRAVETIPKTADLDGWYGITLYQLGMLEHARQYLESSCDQYDSESWVHGFHGKVLWELDENQEALQALERAHDLDPKIAWVLDMLATVELELGHTLAARSHIDQAITLEPEEDSYHLTRAYVLRAQGKTAAAARELASIGLSLNDLEDLPEQLSISEALRKIADTWVAAVILLFVLSIISVLAGARGPDHSRMPRGHTGMTYDGNAKELFRLYLQHVVLTILTLGIYRFWAKVEMKRYRYQHTMFAGGRFDYHATGKEKFIGFCKGMAILAPIPVMLYLMQSRLSEQIGVEISSIIAIWGFFLLLFVLRPVLFVGAQRYNMSRTSWNNLRFRFNGTIIEAYDLYIRDLFLTVFTLGLYSIWHRVNLRKFRMHNTRMGKEGFVFRGTGSNLLRITFGGTFLSWITLGGYLPWYIASRHRFYITNTVFRGAPFRSHLSGKALLIQMAPPMFLAVLTVGLALPWALDRWYRLLADTTSYPKELDTETLQSIRDSHANALIEGTGEAGDTLAEIGDIFGV
ncbi:MAG: uncharacterized membrane protein YjgN (DUF898 family)/Flp pilus assembly protein TadD [Planctomycetota bacterium]|jgi:uncharacterized membrane protein YjgN (DUF898 family)/Flp pilus assembly protein TadD